MEPFALTKEEFITRSMAGEVFVYNNNKFFYNTSFTNPFRINGTGMEGSWDIFNDKTKLFTLDQSKPRIERRWKYRIDLTGVKNETVGYYSDEKARIDLNNNYYKVEDCYIDVEIKD